MSEATLLLVPGILPVAAFLYGLAAWVDLTRRLIPDMVSLAVAVLGIVGMAFGQVPGDILPTLIAAAVAFLLLASLCAAGLIGGGDVKLISTSIILVGASHAIDFLFLTMVAGGVLSILYLAAGAGLRRSSGRTAQTAKRHSAAGPFRLGVLWRAECRRIRRGGPLPYGIAIAAGALMTLGLQPV